MALPWSPLLPDGFPGGDPIATPTPYNPGPVAAYLDPHEPVGAPRDLAMTLAGGLLTDGARLQFTHGKQAVAQQMAINFRAIKGECPWDLDLGLDYVLLGRRGVSDTDIRGELVRVAARVPGVVSVLDAVLTRDKATRRMTAKLRVKTDLGVVDAAIRLLEGV